MTFVEGYMDKIILGKTGLSVTVAGLGCGGFSRIGMGKYGQDHAAGVVRAAYEAGVNFFDTAAAYGTEGAVGQGLAGLPRDSYILSTKFPYKRGDDWKIGAGENLLKSLENSLREMRTEYADIYHLHGVVQKDYDAVCELLLPAMHKAREQGKIRYLGITELFGTDTAHETFNTAVPDNHFDVVMVGYNIINPSAAKFILPKAAELNTGVLCMFAVRSALSNPEQLETDIKRIVEMGQAGEGLTASAGVLDFLFSGVQPAASSIIEAAYRFCRHTPPVHVVLTGTGNIDHLRENLRSINAPPLPAEILERLNMLFGRVDCVSGQ
jgi:aryl-alcohol dehydrogenase-like predicted oxidoreductase